MSVGVNLLKCDDDELDRLRDAVDRFKALRPGLQDAYVYRIASAHEHPYSVLQYVKRDKSEFTLFAFGHGMRQWDKQSLRFRMRGLAPDKLYVSESGVTVSGAALMNRRNNARYVRRLLQPCRDMESYELILNHPG